MPRPLSADTPDCVSHEDHTRFHDGDDGRVAHSRSSSTRPAGQATVGTQGLTVQGECVKLGSRRTAVEGVGVVVKDGVEKMKGLEFQSRERGG